MDNLTVDQAKQFLRERGYFTDNLWHVRDVKSIVDVDDETAHQILDGVLTNEWIVQQIFEMMQDELYHGVELC